MKVNVVIPCGGSGERCGLGFNKLFAPILGKAVIYHTVSKFFNLQNQNFDIEKIILPINMNDKQNFAKTLNAFEEKIIFCDGGNTRTASITNALKLAGNCDIICIHDGARPFVNDEIIEDSLQKASEFGSGIAAFNAVDTIAITNGKSIQTVPKRDDIFCLQTPQSFKAEQILKAYSMITANDNFTDDSGVYQKYIAPCHLSLGSPTNRKITYKQDLLSFENCYIGVGYDTHQLIEGRDLILGGVKIEYEKGLLGHSDADVLTHAIMDAIFGACGERDIGVHFPDTDPKYKGISSILLLTECLSIIRAKGFEIKNINAVIMCQKPKLAKLIPSMIENLAKAMNISKAAINISATTTEGLGFVGREEGIATHCNCICYRI